MKKVQTGDVIQIDETHHNAIEQLTEKLKVAKHAFAEASQMVKESQEMLWQFVRELHPETENVECSINHKSKQITILSTIKRDLDL